MAVVDITEYDKLAIDNMGARVAAGVEPAGVVQQIAVTGTSAPSVAFNQNTKFVRVHTDVTIRIKFGAGTPVVAATSQRMVAGATEYFGVTPGIKMAAITSA